MNQDDGGALTARVSPGNYREFRTRRARPIIIPLLHSARETRTMSFFANPLRTAPNWIRGRSDLSRARAKRSRAARSVGARNRLGAMREDSPGSCDKNRGASNNLVEDSRRSTTFARRFERLTGLKSHHIHSPVSAWNSVKERVGWVTRCVIYAGNIKLIDTSCRLFNVIRCCTRLEICSFGNFAA